MPYTSGLKQTVQTSPKDWLQSHPKTAHKLITISSTHTPPHIHYTAVLLQASE